MNTAQTQRRMLKIGEVESAIGMKKSSIYRWVSEGAFPAPVKMGARAARWDSLAVDAWLNARLGQ